MSTVTNYKIFDGPSREDFFRSAQSAHIIDATGEKKEFACFTPLASFTRPPLEMVRSKDLLEWNVMGEAMQHCVSRIAEAESDWLSTSTANV